MRRLLPLLAFVLPLLFACPVSAQILSVYGTYSPVHVSGTQTGGGGTTSFWSQGFGGGVTFGVLPLGPLRLGLDARASGGTGTQNADLFLVGPKLSVRVPLVRLKPYVQASGGYLRTHTTLVASPFAGSTFTNGFGAYEVLGGVDYPLVPFIDLRLIEVGGGKGYAVSGAGTGSSYTVSLFTVNTGVVVHF